MSLFKQASFVDELMLGMEKAQAKLASADEDAVTSKLERAVALLQAASKRLAAAGYTSASEATNELVKSAQKKPEWQKGMPRRPPPGAGLGYGPPEKEEVPPKPKKEYPPTPEWMSKPSKPPKLQEFEPVRPEKKPEELWERGIGARKRVQYALHTLEQKRETAKDEYGAALLYIISVLNNRPFEGYFPRLGIKETPMWAKNLARLDHSELLEALKTHINQVNAENVEQGKDEISIRDLVQQAKKLGPQKAAPERAYIDPFTEEEPAEIPIEKPIEIEPEAALEPEPGSMSLQEIQRREIERRRKQQESAEQSAAQIARLRELSKQRETQEKRMRTVEEIEEHAPGELRFLHPLTKEVMKTKEFRVSPTGRLVEKRPENLTPELAKARADAVRALGLKYKGYGAGGKIEILHDEDLKSVVLESDELRSTIKSLLTRHARRQLSLREQLELVVREINEIEREEKLKKARRARMMAKLEYMAKVDERFRGLLEKASESPEQLELILQRYGKGIDKWWDVEKEHRAAFEAAQKAKQEAEVRGLAGAYQAGIEEEWLGRPIGPTPERWSEYAQKQWERGELPEEMPPMPEEPEPKSEEPEWLPEFEKKTNRLYALQKTATLNYVHAMRILAGNLDPMSQLQVTAKKKSKKLNTPKNPGKTPDEKKVWRMYGYMDGKKYPDKNSAYDSGIDVEGDPSDEYKVVVIRGPSAPTKIYYYSKPKRASHVADAIAKLHGVQVDVSEDEKTYTIDMSKAGEVSPRFEEEKPGIEMREMFESVPEPGDEGFED